MNCRQLYDPRSATCTYLLWDAASREAVLIDPVRDQVLRDIHLLRELDLRLRFTLETHLHADHITGSGLLRKILNSLVLVHENCGAKCPDILLKDGDNIPLGKRKIGVLHTPGHTRCDVSYVIPGMVFTGDALLIQDCGRADFHSGNAGVLYDSITKRLFSLPDATLVYPGHDYNQRSRSSIGEEKAHNPRIGNGISRNEFIKIMNNLQPDPPLPIQEALTSNLRCGIPAHENAAPTIRAG
jgi:glyoxylase-like metal-dependent hydrolase (beta-lactamase superfamily II)